PGERGRRRLDRQGGSAAAAIAERLGLAGIGTDTAHVMTNKAAMRERLQERSVPQPVFMVVNDDIEPARAQEAVGLPAVLKPADSGGQRGVYKISRRGEQALGGAVSDAMIEPRFHRPLASASSPPAPASFPPAKFSQSTDSSRSE